MSIIGLSLAVSWEDEHELTYLSVLMSLKSHGLQCPLFPWLLRNDNTYSFVHFCFEMSTHFYPPPSPIPALAILPTFSKH